MYMRRTQLYLEDSQRRTLERLSRKSGKSVGQLVREAVDEVYCGKRVAEKPLTGDNPIWSFIGSGESRETDVSERHDHYLYGLKDEGVR